MQLIMIASETKAVSLYQLQACPPTAHCPSGACQYPLSPLHGHTGKKLLGVGCTENRRPYTVCQALSIIYHLYLQYALSWIRFYFVNLGLGNTKNRPCSCVSEAASALPALRFAWCLPSSLWDHFLPGKTSQTMFKQFGHTMSCQCILPWPWPYL